VTAYIFAAVIVVVLAVLLFTGTLTFRGKSEGDISTALRDLLIERAEGRIGAEEFDSRQAALHAAVLSEPQKSSFSAAALLRWAVPLLLVAAAGFFYYSLSNLNPTESTVATLPTIPPLAGENVPAANAGGDLNAMGKRLAEKMAQDPKNGEGWLLLARTYGELKQSREAAQAYAKAAALLPPDAKLLADWADAHVVANDRKWDKAGRDIIKRALSIDGKQLKALALAGSEAFDRGDYKGAIEFWKRLKAAAGADSMDARLAEANIEEASARLGGKPSSAVSKPSAASGGSLSGEVTLAPVLNSRFEKTAVVFVVAKSVDGVGAPLAVLRRQVGDLPLSFVLDDSLAMIPERALSKFPEALVSARISPTGSAIPQRGDVVSDSIRVKVGDKGIKLELLFPR
jgi:cytochrome c-type biogenesis protein CcmH